MERKSILLKRASIKYFIFLLFILLQSCYNSTSKRELSKRITQLESKTLTESQVDSIVKAHMPAPIEFPGQVQQGINIEYTDVTINFATNRNKDELKGDFGKERSNNLHYGQCKITIPKIHKVGEIEKPFLNVSRFSDPTQHIILANTHVQDKVTFYSNLRSRVSQSRDKSAFIFIHGYKTSFEDAAKRTAQIHHDLEFNGAPIFFSWPSQDLFQKYMEDEANIDWAQTHLEQFLKEFLTNTNSENVYIIAHSMGSRAISNVLFKVTNSIPGSRNKIRELILAAPDIDAMVFQRDIAPDLIRSCERVTLYASASDLALTVSKQFHGHQRLGDSNNGVITLLGLESIDATGVDTGLTGHSYFSTSRTIISDISYLINQKLGASKRYGLTQVNGSSIPYWKFNQ